MHVNCEMVYFCGLTFGGSTKNRQYFGLINCFGW